jgi:hypothetical protein
LGWLAIEPIGHLSNRRDVAGLCLGQKRNRDPAQSLGVATSLSDLHAERVSEWFVLAPVRSRTALHASHFVNA